MKQEFKLKSGNILRIIQDESPMDPRSDDNLGKMICWHRRYSLGDKHDYADTDALFEHIAGFAIDEIESDTIPYEEAKKMVYNKAHENAIILPLALYDHSGITMWIGSKPSSFDPGGWDSGQIGWIYVMREQLIKEGWSKEWMDKYHKGKTLEEVAEAMLASEVKTYDQYITGDVYGFQVVKPVSKTWICEETGEKVTEIEEEDVDSCYGFYGHDYKTNGILDYVDDEILEEETV